MADEPSWLIVGLGNPGPTYVANRHNAGSLTVDVLADRIGSRFKRRRARAEVVEARLADRRAILAKPLTYMNESGGPVRALAGFYKVPTDQIVVVHDELDLDFGALRVKLGGGDNGHNGLKSIRRSLGTGEFYRVRFGIGRPPGRQDPAAFVLRDFSKVEQQDLDVHLDRTADAVESLVRVGLPATQNAFNA